MKIKLNKFQVKPGKKIALNKTPTKISPLYKSKNDYQKALDKYISELSELQSLLYADERHSLLLIFQAMDAAGKDGAIKHIMSGVNPQGCRVSSFKRPSAEELRHDFLWRTTRRLPERGQIGIFNRSYYEEALIVKVHPEILLSQNLPDKLRDHKKFWDWRYRSILDFEQHLHRNGTQILKFFLHLSKGEQKKRFIARIDEPEKNWKFNIKDVEERVFWGKYMKAYEDCLNRTSTAQAPWFAVPADDKRNARLIISDIILNTLRDLPMEYPKTSAKRRRELLEIRNKI